jgi:propionyl-CoA carboxylase alpha chain
VRKLLVANRGEIARRVLRTAHAMGIATVAVYSDADARAPHVREAGEAVRIPNYLDGDAIVAAAKATGADAVHPGYGFLSENAGFARACGAAGITFVGPSPEAIEAMGSKIAAKELMRDAGVPVLPSDGLPLLVKAAFGGGGRGMRVVRTEDELAEALASAEREAASAFGDGTVFTERFVDDPRHVEVQIFGDAHGNVLHLFERECSIQRRYQKVIEEAPCPAVDPALREALGDAAVTAAKALGYVGAGTVEFVLAPNGEFFFLEVNTRLQVEHPVTELITGLDLVELQLRIARGEPLDVDPTITGWAVEARLYAEDVPAGYVPTSGPIHRLRFPEGVRVDSGYEDGSTVSTLYDAMLAKVVAWAPTRDEAVARLATALEQAEVHGPTTNRDLLVRVLRHPEFVAGRTDTGFLDRHDGLTEPLGDERVAAVAAAFADRARRATGTIPPGFRNVPTQPQRTTWGDVEVAYRGMHVEAPVEATVHAATPEVVDLTVDGIRRRIPVHLVGDVAYAGTFRLEKAERFPLPQSAEAAGSLLAPMPGAVTRVDVEIGAAVAKGDTLVVLEAMKMEHAIRATQDGTVSEVRVRAGDQVDTGAVLVVVE